jgi:hypothetical protein
MTTLPDYNHFGGRHWETGSVHNALAYQKITAPHTDKPYSEALLLGVSGGITFGYFQFHYEGYPPQVNLLTRNTFDPFDRMLERLGVVQEVRQTGSASKAEKNLIEALENGEVPIVWADGMQFSYTAPPTGISVATDAHATFPIVVFGIDEDTIHIADRARVPLVVTHDELTAARGRVKKFKHRLVTLSAPLPEKLEQAVAKGIWDCINLYTETPPPGPNYKKNFGLDGIAYWIDLLTATKGRKSWAKTLTTGADLYAGLTSAFEFLLLFGKDGGAERATYADFLEEAAVILDKPDLCEVANQFRALASLWDAVGVALLPESSPALTEARKLLLERHRLFLDEGNASVEARAAINAKLEELGKQVADDFPIDDVPAFREQIAAAIRPVHEEETSAVQALTSVMMG